MKDIKVIVEDINAILAQHGIEERISARDITVADKTVSDSVKQVSKLSDCITNQLWPSVRSAVVFHYTSWDSAQSILSSNTFRFGNIEKRYGEGEIITFCETHQLLGYLVPEADGSPRYKNLLMPNTFYASFTESSLTADEEDYFWRNFASPDGVRFTIAIEASNPNFRRILYEKKPGRPIPVLHDLSAVIRARHGREFILAGISRLCAFYLSESDYGREKEYRLICKSWKDIGAEPTGKGPSSYIEVPLGVMTEYGYKLEILDVCANSRPKMVVNYPFTQRGP